MHASAPDAAPGTLQPKLAHASPYAPLDQDFIKYTQRARVALSMRNDDVSAPIHRSRRMFARASHQEPRGQDKVAMHLDAYTIIKLRVHPLPESRNLLEGGQGEANHQNPKPDSGRF